MPLWFWKYAIKTTETGMTAQSLMEVIIMQSFKVSDKEPTITYLQSAKAHGWSPWIMPKSGKLYTIMTMYVTITHDKFELGWIRTYWENTSCRYTFLMTLWPWHYVMVNETGIKAQNLMGVIKILSCKVWNISLMYFWEIANIIGFMMASQLSTHHYIITRFF